MDVEYHDCGRMEGLKLLSRLFRKKEMDREAAEAFWKYFAKEQFLFIDILVNGDSEAKQALVRAIDRMLCPVFPYVKPECIDFQLGSNAGKHEFILYHSGSKPLAKDMYALCEMMPESIRNVWLVSINE